MTLPWVFWVPAEFPCVFCLQSLCFPSSCCGSYSCDSTDGLEQWVGDQFVVSTMPRLCNDNPLFCYPVRPSPRLTAVDSCAAIVVCVCAPVEVYVCVLCVCVC